VPLEFNICCDALPQLIILLLRFDKLLRSAVGRITNSALSDIQWLQASLPIKLRGLGIRRVTSLAIPAYLASAASTLTLQDHILALYPSANESMLLSKIIFRSGPVHLARQLSHGQVSNLSGTDRDCRPIARESKLRWQMQHRRRGTWLQ